MFLSIKCRVCLESKIVLQGYQLPEPYYKCSTCIGSRKKRVSIQKYNPRKRRKNV